MGGAGAKKSFDKKVKKQKPITQTKLERKDSSVQVKKLNMSLIQEKERNIAIQQASPPLSDSENTDRNKNKNKEPKTMIIKQMKVYFYSFLEEYQTDNLKISVKDPKKSKVKGSYKISVSKKQCVLQYKPFQQDQQEYTYTFQDGSLYINKEKQLLNKVVPMIDIADLVCEDLTNNQCHIEKNIRSGGGEGDECWWCR